MLYIHIPYCHGKCSYCAFCSIVPLRDTQPYVEAVCRELRLRADEASSPLRTLYFGGGTPSLLTIDQLKQIIETLRLYYDLSQIEESTIECNPEDLSTAYLQGLNGLRIFNRLSIGIQSFRDADLFRLRRRHTSAEAIQAVIRAYQAGFDNISLDLIYGLPNQSEDDWKQNLQTLSEIDPDHDFIRHLSCYALSVEPGTILSHQVEQGQLVPASEETVLKQYHELLSWSQRYGFGQYEISSFCQPGFHSRHNSRYWNRTPYIGIGAAAHGFNGQHRRWNTSDIKRYISLVGISEDYHESELLSPSDAYNEYVMTSLRTTMGIEKSKLSAEQLNLLHTHIQRFIAAGLIEETSTHYKPTANGLLQADGMAAELFI
ncbi:MAG: radical SAM family heme chaperone HemW [Bacteroidales bacterium]|nr:radical SAM family heme chaperone HemW [Bacteroidales bacterium]